MTNAHAMTAQQVIDALVTHRHSRDLTVAECKDGADWGEDGRPMRRLDLWAMRHTWSPVTTIAYEVKVSRSDFTGDKKWPTYRPLAHEFYFACPSGLIKPSEMNDGVGLVWISKSGRPTTRVKAKRVDPSPVQIGRLMTYILMSRTVIVDSAMISDGARPPITRRERMELIREEVEEADERERTADFVSGHIRKRLDEAKAIGKKADSTAKECDRITEHLASHGIDWRSGESSWNIRRQIDELIGAIDPDTIMSLRHGVRVITKALDALDTAAHHDP